MTATIIDGKAIGAALRARVADEVSDLKSRTKVTPGLAVVLVGDDPASAIYVRNKVRDTREAGMESVEHRLPADTTEADLLNVVRKLNADPAIHGILVQLPLPPQIDSSAIIAAIDPDKDVDGLTVENAGRLAAGLPGLVPCTPLGCTILLDRTLGNIAGKRALVVGRSNLVGKPLVQLLLAQNCTVTVAHSRTRDLPEECRRAEILIAAMGKPEFIRGDWVRPGATVIDVGTSRIPSPDGGKPRLAGDVLFAEAVEVAGAITPVPGGVGPMTIACLLANTVTAACGAAGAPLPNWRTA